MSDKEQPNKISVKTATITESHEHESSVTEAVDGNKAKDSDSNKRKLQDRGSTSDDQSFEKEKPASKRIPQNKSKISSNNKGTQGPGPGAKSHQQKLTDLKRLDVTNNKILEKLNIMDQNIKQMNTKISKTVTVEDLTTKFKTMVTKEFLTTTIEKVKDEIKDMMNEKIDKLESRIFDLELSNDKLKQENDIMKNHISRQEDRMDGLEDGLNLCFQEKNDLEQYTRKSSIRITGLDDHDKDENIEESIKTVHKFLTKTIKMEIKESDINIAHRLGPFRPRQNRPVIVRFMSRKHKLEACKKRKILKGTQYVIKEDLTQTNQNFLNELYNAPNINSAWSHEGKIFVKLKETGRIQRVFLNTDCANLY